MNISPPRKTYRENGNAPLFSSVLQPTQENLVPDEYKQNSQMVGKLVKQNKELQQQLKKKDQEVEKLTVLSRSLRDKLAKYTKLNAELKEQLEESKRSRSRGVQETRNKDDDLLQKLRVLVEPKDPNDEVLEKLRGLLLERPVRDEDILVSESEEMLALKRRVDELKKRLAIKKQNEQRKHDLQQEVESLLATLETPRPRSHGKHCSECYSPVKRCGREEDSTVDKYSIWE